MAGSLSGGGLALSGRQHIAHAVLRREPGTLQRGLDDMLQPSLWALKGVSPPIEGPSGARGGENDDGIGGCGHDGNFLKRQFCMVIII